VEKSIEALSYENIRNRMEAIRLAQNLSTPKPSSISLLNPINIYRRRRTMMDLYDEARLDLTRTIFDAIEEDLKTNPLITL